MPRSATALLRLSIAALVATALYVSIAIPANAWFIAGSELTGTAGLATTAAVTENFKLKGAGVTIECTGSTLSSSSPEITVLDELSVSKLSFNGCTASEPCSTTKSFGTVPVSADFIEQTLEEDKAQITPKTKTVLATVKFEGASCALLGTQPITGEVNANFPTGQLEKTLQEIRMNTVEESKELKIGSSAAEFKGAASLKLATEKIFAALLPVVKPSVTELKFKEINAGAEEKLMIKYKNEGKGAWPFTNKRIAFIHNGPMGLMKSPFELMGAGATPCNNKTPENTECEVEVKFTPELKGLYEYSIFALPAARPFTAIGKAK